MMLIWFVKLGILFKNQFYPTLFFYYYINCVYYYIHFVNNILWRDQIQQCLSPSQVIFHFTLWGFQLQVCWLGQQYIIFATIHSSSKQLKSISFSSGFILLLQDGLPLPQPLSYGEAGDHAVDFSPPFAHVVLDVKDERLLAKVSVDNLAWSLKAHSGVQVGLKDKGDQTW